MAGITQTLPDSSTNLSLLASLVKGSSASESWPIFVEKYGYLLHQWCLRWGASEHDAEEVVQDTLLTIYQKLELYRKQEGVSFRAWLKKVAFRCWLGIIKSRKNMELSNLPISLSRETVRLLSQAEAREDLIAEFDRMATDEIIEFASRRVASRVEEKTWLCYELTYFHELSSQEIAHQLGMNPPAVLMAVSRIRQMLRQEIRQLDPDHH